MHKKEVYSVMELNYIFWHLSSKLLSVHSETYQFVFFSTSNTDICGGLVPLDFADFHVAYSVTQMKVVIVSRVPTEGGAVEWDTSIWVVRKLTPN